MARKPHPHREPVPARSILVRLVVMAALWWVLTEGRGAYQWPVGVLVIAAATWASLALKVSDARRRSLSLRGALAFVPMFLKQSVLGGIDVALRALKIRRHVRPAWVELHLRLADEPARVFLAAVLSLMPGTLSVQLARRRLRIHVLDQSLVRYDAWRRIERRVARLLNDRGDAAEPTTKDRR